MDLQNYNIAPFTKFDKDWALLTVGEGDDFNSMTISWGGMGTLWHKPVLFLFVKPTRYTYDFVRRHEDLTVSFYADKHKKVLGKIFGSQSGKDIDKAKEAGFTPKQLSHGVTYAEAEETLVGKKLFMQQLNRDDFPEEALAYYPEGKEFPGHYLVVAEVLELSK